MKKYYLPIILASLMLAGCGSKTNSSTTTSNSESQTSEQTSNSSTSKLDLSVACPSGAPAIALSKYIKDSNLEINADASNIVTYMKAGSKDIIVLPTNAGIQNIKKESVPYKIASTITFGNFYIAGTGNDDNEVMDEGDTVVIFQKNNVPDKLFQYVYSDLYSSLDISYVNMASDAARCLVTGVNEADNKEVDYVLIAEPALSKSLPQNEKAYRYADIQSLYKEKSNNAPIMQASIFVKNTADTNLVNTFLSEVNTSINQVISDSSILDSYTQGMDIVTLSSKLGGDLLTIKNCISNGNSIGIGYKNAFANKNAIDNFIKMWPAIGEASEEIYYK